MTANYPDPKKVSGHLDAVLYGQPPWPLCICLFPDIGHKTDAPVNTILILSAISLRIRGKQLTALPSGPDAALYVSHNTERLVLPVPGIRDAGMVLSASMASSALSE